MAITAYTTYDTIRVLLGVSSKEIKDATLALAVFESQFLLELSDVDQGGTAVATEYARIVAIAVGSRTANEQRFFDLVNMLAAYSVAKQLLGADGNLIPQRITDGKAELVRRPDVEQRVREAIIASYNQLTRRLKALLLVLVPAADVAATVSRTFILSTGLATDPVTDE